MKIKVDADKPGEADKPEEAKKAEEKVEVTDLKVEGNVKGGKMKHDMSMAAIRNIRM